MKKYLVFALCFLMVFALCACSSGTSDGGGAAATESASSESSAAESSASEAPASESSSDDAAASESGESAAAGERDPLGPLATQPPADGEAADTGSGEKYTIATIAKDMSGEWFKRMEVGVNKFASDTGHNAYEVGPSSYDAALQLQNLENVIAQGVDAICIVPIDPATVEPALKRAMDAGIVVITHESPDVENSYFNVEAGPLEDYAYRLMDVLAEGMGEEGTWVGVVGSLTVPTHMTWCDLALERQLEKYPNMKLSSVDRVESHDTKEGAYEVTKELLRANPDITGILCVSDMDSLGAAQAIDELGLKDKVVVAGGGLPSTHREAIKNGEVLSCGLWDPAQSGYAMNALAVALLEADKDPAAIGETFDAGIKYYDDMVLEDKTYYANGIQVWTKETIDNEDAVF